MTQQAVILAGGLATRMRPMTETIAKSMLVVAGRPFVDWLLERLTACGFDEVVMCVGRLGSQLRAHVGDGARYGVSVLWSDEGDDARGTAGALRLALPLLAPMFLLTYGDSYLPFDYASPLSMLASHADCDGVMSAYPNSDAWDASNVVTDGVWVRRYEKGVRDVAFDHIDYGALALRRDVVAALPAEHRGDLAPLLGAMAAKDQLRALVAAERFFEIGSPEGLATLARHLRPT